MSVKVLCNAMEKCGRKDADNWGDLPCFYSNARGRNLDSLDRFSGPPAMHWQANSLANYPIIPGTPIWYIRAFNFCGWASGATHSNS